MEFSRQVPIGRIGRPEEIAEAALYFRLGRGLRDRTNSQHERWNGHLKTWMLLCSEVSNGAGNHSFRAGYRLAV